MRFDENDLIRGGFLAPYLVSLLTIDALSKGRFERHAKSPRPEQEQPREEVATQNGLPPGVTVCKAVPIGVASPR